MNETQCKTPKEIDEYIRRIQVDTWANFYETDFLIQNGTPAARIEKWVRTDVLDPKRNKQNWLTIEENQI